MRIAFYGGSFDPPHTGHLTIALAAARQFALDRVLLAPTGLQPFKRGGAEAPYADRLEMARLLCLAEPALLQASAIDAPRADGQPNYTVDTLQALSDEQPGAELFALLGVDGLLDLPRWHRAEQLFTLAQWIAVSRPGFTVPLPLPAPLEAQRDLGRLHLILGVAVPHASHQLRARLREGRSCEDAVPGAVLAYIKDHHLYEVG